MALPTRLARTVQLFQGAPKDLKLQALLEYSRKVPPLPARYAEHPDLLERVTECQTPFFLAVDVDGDQHVTIAFECPPEAPTTRGYAGILADGLEGATAAEVLAVPDDFYTEMGLEEAVSMLRLRGMSAIMARLKRQVAAQVATIPVSEASAPPPDPSS
jgi:cysteine desulfuration protein SufE